MQTLQQENAKLAQTIQQFLQEIERQKELNVQHQNQIETLLHFNQRLLLIIENQMNNRRDTCSLQPISERSERSSDLLGTCTLQSLIRSKKMAVKSEWGGATRESLIERKKFKDFRNNIFDQVSEAESLRNQKSEPQTETFKAPSQNILFRSQVRKGLEELKQFKDKTNTFYTQKMSELKSLSSKITAYHPLNELSKIGQKACVSDETMSLIRRRVFKSP